MLSWLFFVKTEHNWTEQNQIYKLNRRNFRQRLDDGRSLWSNDGSNPLRQYFFMIDTRIVWRFSHVCWRKHWIDVSMRNGLMYEHKWRNCCICCVLNAKYYMWCWFNTCRIKRDIRNKCEWIKKENKRQQNNNKTQSLVLYLLFTGFVYWCSCSFIRCKLQTVLFCCRCCCFVSTRSIYLLFFSSHIKTTTDSIFQNIMRIRTNRFYMYASFVLFFHFG